MELKIHIRKYTVYFIQFYALISYRSTFCAKVGKLKIHKNLTKNIQVTVFSSLSLCSVELHNRPKIHIRKYTVF